MRNDKVLIVEDEPALRYLCAAILESINLQCIPTVDGLDGLEVYRERHEEIGLVLSDITMPRMNGIELARNVFGMNCYASIILMSGYSLSSVVPEELKGLCSVLQKPFTAKRLIDAVQKVLGV